MSLSRFRFLHRGMKTLPLWSPDAETIASYQNSDLILLNGATYAKWTERVALPASKLVDTSAAFHDSYIVIENATVHSHGPEGEHSHGETAFTTWLDPTLAVEQARAIRDAFVSLRPDSKSAFETAYEALASDLMALDGEIEAMVAKNSDVAILGSHPVYQYLARRYALNLRAVHFEPDAVPGEDGWHDLEHLLEDVSATWMIWENSPLSETSEKLRGLGLESIVFNPCGNRPEEGDYLSVMRANIEAFERIFASD